MSILIIPIHPIHHHFFLFLVLQSPISFSTLYPQSVSITHHRPSVTTHIPFTTPPISSISVPLIWSSSHRGTTYLLRKSSMHASSLVPISTLQMMMRELVLLKSGWRDCLWSSRLLKKNKISVEVSVWRWWRPCERWSQISIYLKFGSLQVPLHSGQSIGMVWVTCGGELWWFHWAPCNMWEGFSKNNLIKSHLRTSLKLETLDALMCISWANIPLEKSIGMQWCLFGETWKYRRIHPLLWRVSRSSFKKILNMFIYTNSYSIAKFLQL
jgi:hypothetical protein